MALIDRVLIRRFRPKVGAFARTVVVYDDAAPHLDGSFDVVELYCEQSGFDDRDVTLTLGRDTETRTITRRGVTKTSLDPSGLRLVLVTSRKHGPGLRLSAPVRTRIVKPSRPSRARA